MSNLTTKVEKINIDSKKRIIATCDIHGHGHYLKGLLEKVNFSENDELFLVGDFIERGMENLKCLRYIMELSKLPNVHPIIGNNDAFIFGAVNDPKRFKPEMIYNYILDKVAWHGSSTLKEMATEIGLEFTGPENVEFVLSKIREKFTAEREFIYSIPTVIDTQNFTFVHAGLPNEDFSEFESLNPLTFMRNDDFLGKGQSFKKFVVVGHWPTILYKGMPDCSPIFSMERKILSLDGGCGVKNYGQLNALIVPNINSTDFSFIKYDDFPKITSEIKQEETENPVVIIWGKNDIEILEQGEFVSTVKHILTGKTIKIPTNHIYHDEKGSHSLDFTNYRHKLEIGDTLSLVEEVEGFGSLVKKNSKVGWYKAN